MERRLLQFLILCISFGAFAQDPEYQEDLESGASDKIERKFQKDKEEKEKPPITDYKIISYTRDTTYVDTTLNMQKEYKFNYLRQDNFELLPFSNTGRSYNSLAKVVEPSRLMPRFGARARHFNYIEVEDVSYYHVPTPLTEIYFKTATEQGQQLDTFFTINISPQINFSFAYRGLRSLGRYQNILTSTGNFRSTASYRTENGRYTMRTHFTVQDLMNEENGGLTPIALETYLLGLVEGDRESDNRGSLEVNYEDAESLLKGKRFYLDHEYAIVKKSDSTANAFSLRHQMDLTDKSYTYDQSRPSDLFGDSYVAGALKDVVSLEDFTNELSLNYSNKYLGAFSASGIVTNYNYGYNSVIIREDSRITNRIKGESYAVGASYHKTYKGFELSFNGKAMVMGEFTSNYLQAAASYALDKENSVKLMLSSNTVAPNYNFLLYQSNYINYNWQNDQFKNTERNAITLDLQSKKLLDLKVDYSTLLNHTYFNEEQVEEEQEEGDPLLRSVVVPRQSGEQINLLKVKLHRDIRVWHFGLDNTFMYQKVGQGDGIYHVPEFVTRNAFYYHDEIFKKALYLQTGFMVKYFTEYKADAYDPLLAEFYTQNSELIGGFPVVDFFINAKVRQTRIFFKLENFNELFDQNTNLSAPLYPYRDFLIRFGLVWDFFL